MSEVKLFIKYSLDLKQIDIMKHTIGFRRDRIKGKKYPKYEAFRNYFCTCKACDDFEMLKDLENQGLMDCKETDRGSCYFHLTDEGIKYLADITDVKITMGE